MSADKFWFNVRTRQVEQGPQSSATDRLGPYETYAEAAQALERARQRTLAWDDQDEEDEDWGAPTTTPASGGSATGLDVDALGAEGASGREP